MSNGIRILRNPAAGEVPVSGAGRLGNGFGASGPAGGFKGRGPERRAGLVISTVQRDLFEGARYGDEGRVRQAIKAGADVNSKNEEGLNAVSVASRNSHSGLSRSHLSVISLLEKNNADLKQAIGLAESNPHDGSAHWLLKNLQGIRDGTVQKPVGFKFGL